MNQKRQSSTQPQFYINTLWFELTNYFNNIILVKEIQMNEDEPLFYIAKCPSCRTIFYTKKSAYLHSCIKQDKIKFDMAMLYLIRWISVKMLSINAVENPLFKTFCQILNPRIEIPSPRKIRSIIISFSDFLLDYSLLKSHSHYFSILFDGAKKTESILFL